MATITARKNKQYSDEDVRSAIAAISDGMSYREASKKFAIPVTTLCDHNKKRSEVGVKAGRKESIPKDMEEKIVGSILESARSGFPMTKSMVLTRIGRLVARLDIKTQFKDGQPGDKYWRGLRKRFPQLTVRTPECCSNNRLRSLTEERVMNFFDDLHHLSAGLSASCIWNMDETGLQFQHKPSKVVAEKGQRTLHARTSDSKETVTVVACINAAGDVMPPLLIGKGKTQRSVQSFATYLGPPNALWTFQQKGWMENSLGLEWFREVFLRHCGPRRPQLLLLDSHSSHEVLELLELAKEENIHIFALPPHTTQVLQPLDTVVFKPFKAAYNKACTNFLYENPSRVIDKQSFPLMLQKAWEVLYNPELLQKAFRVTGIYPPNRYAISSDNFMSSRALDRPLPSPSQGPASPIFESHPGTLPSPSQEPAPSIFESHPGTLPSPSQGPASPIFESHSGTLPSPFQEPAPSTFESHSGPLPSTSLGLASPIFESHPVTFPSPSEEPAPSIFESHSGPLPSTSQGPAPSIFESSPEPLPSTSQESAPSFLENHPGPFASTSEEPAPSTSSSYHETTEDGIFKDLLTQALEMSGVIDDMVDYAMTPTTTDDAPEADWNPILSEVFATPVPEPRSNKRQRCSISSHRLLTNDDIIQQKRQKQQEKEEMEKRKNERLQNKKKSGPQPKRSSTGKN